MLLSIDPTRVAQQLAKTTPAYIVVPFNLDAGSIAYDPPTADVYSTATGMPPDVERARARLLALRRRLIESGASPLSSEDLERHMDETRGR